MKWANILPCSLTGSALFISLTAFSQIASQVLSPGEITKGYAELDARVLQMLPPHSALPPLLDLSKPEQSTPGAGKQWEDRFTGSMGVRPIHDWGVSSVDTLTSVST